MESILFFDIDGTLAMPGNPPGAETVSAIRAARANGHRVLLSTGRPEYSIPEAINAIGFDGGIYCAGGRIVIHGETIFDQPMGSALSRQIIEVLRAFDLSFNLECTEHNYHYAAPGETLALDASSAGTELQRILQMDQNDPHSRRFEDYDGEPIYKISFRVPSKARFDEVRDRLSGAVKAEGPLPAVCFENLKWERNFRPDFPLLRGRNFRFCEVSDPKVNKGGALEMVCWERTFRRYFDMRVGQSIARGRNFRFGDSMNDAEILWERTFRRAAGIGVAMGSGSSAPDGEERLKALTDRICESCDEDGVAKELARLKLI